jgi:hypothetical protein
MDRRPDVQRNLELSGSTALTAFLDGSADVGSFSRCYQNKIHFDIDKGMTYVQSIYGRD